MKRVAGYIAVAAITVIVGGGIISRKLAARHAAQIQAERAAWEAERAELQAALDRAQKEVQRPRNAPSLPIASPPAGPNDARVLPKEIIGKLQALRGNSPAVLRQAVYLLEELVLAGPSALPSIKEFLARYEDVDLDTAQLTSRAARDRIPLEFSLPPTLRFGLFDVTRRIGGADAESILVESLGRTGRGVEIAWLAAALQQMAPDKYRDQAVGIARGMLANTTAPNPGSPLDRNHRDYLFSVLAMFGDTSFAAEAQAQLVRTDSQIDRGALKYLQQTLGPQAVPIVAQAYQNPLLTNSAAKEPLARAALNFVGADPQANAFYQETINDPSLSKSHRKNLIEDLNQDGFADTKNLTARDLPLIQNRIALIEQLAPNAMDDANAAAFREAYKDLLDMRAKVTGQPKP